MDGALVAACERSGETRKVPETEVAYRCDSESFTPSRRHAVRWLDPEADLELVMDHWRRSGRSICSEDLHARAAEGFTYAGVVEDGVLVARAARWTYSDAAWELAAVATIGDRRGEGLARSVCSFVTEAILAGGRLATCHTHADNTAMRRVAESIGYTVAE